MKSQRNIARLLCGLTLTLVGLMSWNPLPIHLPERTVQAATRARVTEPTGQPVSRAAANGRIAFVSSEGNARADIYTMEADGSNVQRLTNNPAYDQGPKWSPDGTKIAFASSRDDTSVGCVSGGVCKHEIYVMNADGTNQTRTNNPVFEDFDWSPDSTRIVFESIHDGSVNISVMNADGSNVQRLTNYPGFDLSPKWSPDGTKMAFVRTDDWFGGALNISVMNADGTNQTGFSDPPGYGPRWSPDGTKILFVGMFGSSHEICVMKTDGSNVQRLTNNLAYDSTPKWSPDGSKITFIRCGDSNPFGCSTTPHLWGVNADGSNPTKLTDTQAWDHAWSPDGTKIIFGGPGSGAADLFVMNPDGSGLTNITNTSGKYELSPSWQPLPLTLPNPIDDAQFFVRQHYLDFLNREPDAGGLAYWTNRITECGGDELCIRARRIAVSDAFFFEPEFQQTGSYVFRLYRAAYGNNQPFPNPDLNPDFPNEEKKWPSYAVFVQDRARVIGGANLAQSQLDLANAFVQRPEFLAKYPASLTGPQFVDALLATIQTDCGVDLASQREGLIGLFNQGGRGAVSYRLADDNQQSNPINNRGFIDAEYSRAFVFNEYAGYLRRDSDLGGLTFWLGQVNRYPLRDPDVQHAVVCSFITSIEYQQRFGSAVTHSNQECPQ